MFAKSRGQPIFGSFDCDPILLRRAVCKFIAVDLQNALFQEWMWCFATRRVLALRKSIAKTRASRNKCVELRHANRWQRTLRVVHGQVGAAEGLVLEARALGTPFSITKLQYEFQVLIDGIGKKTCRFRVVLCSLIPCSTRFDTCFALARRSWRRCRRTAARPSLSHVSALAHVRVETPPGRAPAEDALGRGCSGRRPAFCVGEEVPPKLRPDFQQVLLQRLPEASGMRAQAVGMLGISQYSPVSPKSKPAGRIASLMWAMYVNFSLSDSQRWRGLARVYCRSIGPSRGSEALRRDSSARNV